MGNLVVIEARKEGREGIFSPIESEENPPGCVQNIREDYVFVTGRFIS